MARRRRTSDFDPRLVLAGLLVVSFVMAIIDGRGSSSLLSPVRTAAVTFVSPMQSVANSIAAPIVGFFVDWSEVGSKDEQIAALSQENEILRQKLLTNADSRRRARELDALLNSAGVGTYTVVLARVMSFGSSSGFGSTILIDAGSLDGIEKNMNVMSGDGLVGRITAVTPTTSTVVLLMDPTSTVGARIAGSGSIGFLSGTGKIGSLLLEFIDSNAIVREGDRLVSYGVSGGIFVPGLPLGTVTKVEKAEGTTDVSAEVKPFANFGSLDLVGVVISGPRTDPRDGLLPTPSAQPTITVTATVTVAAGDGAVITEPSAKTTPAPQSTASTS